MLRLFIPLPFLLTAPAVASIAPPTVAAQSFELPWNADAGGALTLSWDASNRLQTAVNGGVGGVNLSYAYDPLGRRISKIRPVNSTTSVATHYLYDGADIHAEYQAWDQPRTLYVHGQGVDQPLAKLPLTAVNQFDAARYYHSDAQGSIHAVTQQVYCRQHRADGLVRLLGRGAQRGRPQHQQRTRLWLAGP